MSSVDNRVVELKFDNKQFEAGTAQSMATIEKLKKSLDFSSSQKSMADLAATTGKFDMGNLGTVVEGVSGKFLALATIGVTALTNITNQAIETGKTIYKSLTVDPIHAGFSEYELKLNAIQTIMAGSGEKLKTVNKYLNELNTYSDKTIYSFSNMTQNIGKFTNAGISLKTSVAAIQGIANVAAVSGANADEAGRAMYNFAQALSKGSVALIDWKSIEIANMGTVEFKQQLIDAAVAQGTLTKKGNQYVTGKGKMLSASKGFNDSLQDEWLSTKVLTTTLGKYADIHTKIGKKAFAAAENVKTLSQLYDTLKESAGSGWAETFEIVFGNLHQATKLWTGLNTVVGGWIQTSAENRNAMLRSFKAMGGVKMAIEAVKAAFQALLSWIKPVKDAWATVFAGDTAATLLHIVTNLKLFFQAITLGPESMNNLKRTFVGLFSIIDLGRQVVMGVFHFFVGLFDLFHSAASGGGSGILALTANLGDMIANFDEMVKKGGAINTFFDNLLSKLKPAVDFLGRIGAQIGDAFSKAPAIFDKLGGSASGANDQLTPLQKTMQVLEDAWNGFVQAVEDSWDFLKSVANGIADAFTASGDGAKTAFNGIGEAFQKADWPTIFKAALAGGFLAGIGIFFKALYSAVNLFLSQPANILKTIRQGFLEINKVINEFQNTLKQYQQNLKAQALLTIAAAILVLAIALTIISRIPYKQLGKATLAIGALFFMLKRTTESISEIGNGKDFKKIPAIALGMFILGGAMLLLALALKIMAGIPFDQLIKGFTVFALVMFALVDTMEHLGKIKGKMLEAAAAILVLGVAMLVLVGALWVYSKLPIEVIVRGGLAIAVVLAAIGLAMNTMPKEGKLLASAAAILVLSFALGRISEVIAMLGAMDPQKFLQAMYGLAGVMILMVGALLLLSDPLVLVGAAAMIIAAQSLNILARTLEIIGNLSIAQIVTAIATLVLVMASIAVVSAVLAPAIPLIALFGAALLILGAGMALFGLGALAFATAFSIAVGIAALGAPVLKNAIENFTAVIPALAEAFYQALTQFAVAFTRAIPVLIRAVTTFFTELLKALDKMVPRVMHTLGVFLDAFVLYITKYIPKLVDAGLRMINGILAGIAANLPQLIANGTAVIVAWIQGMGKAALEIVTAAGDTLILFLEGLTTWINENSDRLNQAGVDLVHAIIDGMVNGVGQFGSLAVDAVKGMASNMVNGVKGFLHIGSPSKVFHEIGKNITQGLVNGVVAGKDDVKAMLKSVHDQIKEARQKIYADLKEDNKRIRELEKDTSRTKTQDKELAKLKAERKNLEAEQRKIDKAWKTVTTQHKKQRAALIALGKDYDKTKAQLEAATQALDDAIQARDDYNKQITDQYSALPDIAPETTLDQYFDQIRTATLANQKFLATLDQLRAMGLDDTSYRKLLEQGTDAQGFATSLAEAGGAAVAELNNIDQSLADSASALGKTASTELYQAGVDSAQGIVDGLESHMDEIIASMKKIGKAIADELRKELGIKSPSKVFAEIGKFTVQGLAEGMTQNAAIIDTAAKAVGQTAIDGLRDSMSDLSSVIGSEVNLEPVIAPVLDLDQFRKDAAAVTGILTPNSITPSTSASAANDISTKAAALKVIQDQTAAEGGSVVEYNQYNTSPKALSSAEIYRQTKNQLSIVKEALNR